MYNLRNNRHPLLPSKPSSTCPTLPISSVNDGNKDIGCMKDSHKRYTKHGVSTFIKKLFNMINDVNNQHLISWSSNGCSFIVRNANRFAKEVLSDNFKHSNFSSFVRQLNMYGFHKINKTHRGQRGRGKNEIWEFSHPKFQRDRPDLLEDIKRKVMEAGFSHRETDDIHASFNIMQSSQFELLKQFRGLQEKFANLLQDFQEMKKTQVQQQIVIGQLAERQGIPIAPTSLNNFENNPSLFVTSPPNDDIWNLHPNKQQDLMISSTNQNQQDQLPNFNFSMEIPDALPPSPAPSVVLTSPSSPYSNEEAFPQQDTLIMGYPEQ